MNTFVCFLLACALTHPGWAQSAPPPPQNGAAPAVQVAHRTKLHRQPPPPPAGGFWVVENRDGQNRPTVVHFYTDDQREIQTDTVRERLNIRKRAVVQRLNSRLVAALTGQAEPALATRREKP